MDKNLDHIAEELFAKLRSQFSKIKLGDENSETTDEEHNARSFEFPYEDQERALGTVTVTISEEDGLVAIYSNDIMENQSNFVKKRFFNFLKELREFAKQNVMSFDTRDIAKDNLEKRDYKHLSKKHGEGNMNESKLWGTARTSYQEIGEAKIVVKHSAPINFDNPAGRTQRIESIYIENAVGERFRYPFKHLNGARALAQHVSHGGNPYDSIGQYVVGLSEELANLRMFKGYVDRHPLISETMGSVQDKVANRIDFVKKEIFTLQNPTHYSTFAESFTVSEKQEIPEDIMNDLVDRLTVRSFKEELKSVFPFIYKLIDESDIPVKELTAEDLISEEKCSVCEMDPCDCDHKETKEVKEFADYERMINRIAEDTTIFSDNEDAKAEAIDRLNQLIGAPMPVGVDGTNAIESLGEIIDDEELMDVFKELADIDPESDARDILKDYITIKDEENGTDVLSQLNFSDEEETPTAPPEPEVAAEPVAAEPAPAAPAPAQPAPVAETDNSPPWDVDPKDKQSKPVTPGKHGQGYSQARHLARQGMAKAIAKAKKAGATSETLINFGNKQVTLETLAKMVGMQVEDSVTSNQGELVEFIKSMFDETTGQFPKGEEGVRIACEKKFGENVSGLAEKVMSQLQNINEMNRVKKLAGLNEFDVKLMQPTNAGTNSMFGADIAGSPEVKAIIKTMKPEDYIETNKFKQEYPSADTYLEKNKWADVLRGRQHQDMYNFVQRYNRDNNNLSIAQWLEKAKNSIKGAVTGQPAEPVSYNAARFDPTTKKTHGYGMDTTKPEKQFPANESNELESLTAMLRIAGLR